jgi:DNA end-binding protein Ku
MRAIWNGAISFGLVTIPVKLYPATEQKDVRFHLLHKTDGARIVEKRFCERENVEVGWDDLVRGYEVAKGEYVILDPEEIDAARPESSTTIEIGDFVELSEIDPIYFEKSYFLEPAAAGAKPFNLLMRALEETGRVAVARVTIRSKERLATLRTYDGTLVLETMFWPDEIRSTGGLDLPAEDERKVSSRELQMAEALVQNLSARFDPAQYRDQYRAALEELIRRKMKGEQRNQRRRRPEPKVVDLMEALQASVSAMRHRAGGQAGGPRATGRGAGGKPAGRRPRRSRAA